MDASGSETRVCRLLQIVGESGKEGVGEVMGMATGIATDHANPRHEAPASTTHRPLPTPRPSGMSPRVYGPPAIWPKNGMGRAGRGREGRVEWAGRGWRGRAD